MHGQGVFAPFRVPVRELELPKGMSPVTVAGNTFGLVAYIEYSSPSPLIYRELIFMPCMVRVPSGPKGYWVSRMYVDNEASLRGGRELWALPKTLAKFEENDAGVSVQAEDGTTLGLSFRGKGPRLPVKSSVVTLQADDVGWVRFRGDFRARMQLARVRVTQFASSHPGWRGFDPRRQLPLPCVRLASFESQMQPPRRFEAKPR